MQSLDCELASQSRMRAARRIYRRASPTEMIYIQTQTNVVSRSSISGAVNREQFDAAVACLEARYGILRSVVEDGQFVERTDDSPAVESWLFADTWSADALYAKLLNAGLDTRRMIYSIHVIAGEDALDVFMLSTHAVTDATSLVELHASLAYLCDCIVRGQVPALETQPFPTPLDAAVTQSLASLPEDRIGDPTSYSGAFAKIPLRARCDDGPQRRRLERTVIKADDMHRVHAAAHAHGSSVHALLLAAFALAIGDVATEHPRQILMRSSMDMRRRLEPHISAELVFTAITGHVTRIPDLDRPLFDIAKLIFDDIHEGVANGSVFHTYLNYPKLFGGTQQPPVALNVSDMQAINFRWPTQQLKVTGFDYACGLKNFPNVSVAIFDGALVANTVYAEELIDPAIMRAISERVVERLDSACR
ncbi:phthiocerol/phthiodiolone dimycocerosyl transferase family protein [Paraburkholderia fungorum]|uniref:phthiocerol/phthiodiolone dimycocerosyl transferase family protein n=1 Tax=Paraburkholderia fungorum TaxID=134537 RepID=UPI0038B8E415